LKARLSRAFKNKFLVLIYSRSLASDYYSLLIHSQGFVMNQSSEHTSSKSSSSVNRGNWLIVLAVVALAALPLIFVRGEYGGADGEAEAAITEIRPEYEPWFGAIFEPHSGEVESLLFVLQGAIGAGVIGYVVGLYKGRRERLPSSQASNSEQESR
jgi:cobalt/nickel transport protein